MRSYSRLAPGIAGMLTVLLVLAIDRGDADRALAQSWPPFVLVAGLLLVGQVAGRDGLFEAAATRIARLPGPPAVLLGGCYALVAVVTALLNLDTAAVFLTPVLLVVAKRRGLDQLPFLYGCVFMVNASSLFLPGSNLTNLLVLSRSHVSGGGFLREMLPSAIAAPLVTAFGLLLIHRQRLKGTRPPDTAVVPWPIGLGLAGVVLAAGLMVLLRNAALPVLGVGLFVSIARLWQGRVSVAEISTRLGIPVLLGLFGAAVGLGVLARASGFPGDILGSAGPVESTVIAAVASIAVNNLPAAVLLSAGHPHHPAALLLGLNVGPNLAVTGALSALLWWRAARGAGASPSAREFSRQGLLLAPPALAVALLAHSTL